MGFQVLPALVVFHTPPEAAATYQVALSFGWTARSITRPEVRAGPMLRSASPEKVSALMRSLGLSLFLSLPLASAGLAAKAVAGESRSGSRAAAARIRLTCRKPPRGWQRCP